MPDAPSVHECEAVSLRSGCAPCAECEARVAALPKGMRPGDKLLRAGIGYTVRPDWTVGITSATGFWPS